MADPITTVILLAAMVMPAASRKEFELYPAPRVGYDSSKTDSASTFIRLVASSEPATVLPRLQLPNDVLNLRDVLRDRVSAYALFADGWDGEASVAPSGNAIFSLNQVIDKLPGSLRLPSPMISRDGEIALYWNFGDAYAEIRADADGEVLFFSRSSEGIEQFIDNLNLDTLNPKWFMAKLEGISNPLKLVA